MFRKLFLGWLVLNAIVGVISLIFQPGLRVYVILWLVFWGCVLVLDATSGVSTRRP